MNKIIITICILISLCAHSQTMLSENDIEFIGVNADATKGFSFITKSDLEAGSKIYFTDAAWVDTASSFVAAEGSILFTTISNVLAGTVFHYRNATTNEFSKSGSFSLSTSGDNIIAFQIFNSDTTFIAAIGWGKGQNWVYANNTNTSDIPKNLNQPISVIQLGTFDNYRVSDTVFTLADSILLYNAITDATQFVGNNDSAYSYFSEFTLYKVPFVTPPVLIDSSICYNETFANISFSTDSVLLFLDKELLIPITENTIVSNNLTFYAIAYENGIFSSPVVCTLVLFKQEEPEIEQVSKNILYCNSYETPLWFTSDNQYIATSNHLTVSCAGEYYAIATDNNKCSYATKSISINQASTELVINNKVNERIEIYSITGIKISESKNCSVHEAFVDIGVGIYFIKCINNKITTMQTFIIE